MDHVRQGVPGAFKEAERSDMTLPASLVIPTLGEPLRREPCEFVMDSGPRNINEAPTSTAETAETSGDGSAEAPSFQRPQRVRQLPTMFPEDIYERIDVFIMLNLSV